MKTLRIILLSVLIGLVLFFSFLFISKKQETSETYQAVFLVNTQVYFGKLSQANSQYPILTDVYYLQIDEDLSRLKAEDVSKIRLIKLGGELHGPTDQMKINRDQIVLIEDLRADSNIVEAIKQYKTQRSQ